MTVHHSRQLPLTRRGFLGGTAAAIGLSALPSGALAQQYKYTRWEISDPNIPSNIIPSYKKAVAAMLQLEPSDPRNWYRNAMVHLLDCPHRNWWFVPWHRGYTGWLEQICRELSGDADFALPYWDWTKSPVVPPAMFEDVLDPNNAAFIPTSTQFQTDFAAAVTALYGALTPEQQNELDIRGYSTEADFWADALGSFADQPGARGLTSANPNLPSWVLTPVSLPTIQSALRVPVFSGSGPAGPGFASAIAAQHSASAPQGIMESQPHNNVHGGIGGFMGAFLSSVDPIFFLHHGNIDRLWDVWTRRQQALGRPTLPEGAELTAWSDEPFLFFSGPNGQPVAQTKAGDYAEIGMFNYGYSPGSGEDEVPAAMVAAAPAAMVAGARVAADVSAAAADTGAGGIAEVPAAMLAAAEEPTAPPVVAEVTLNLDENDMGRTFRVLVTPPGAAEPVEAGTIFIFGHHEPGPQTFAVPLPPGLAGNATAAGAAATAETVPLDIRVEEVERAEMPGMMMGAQAESATEAEEGAPVASIEVTSG